jgi:hypothetical protein
MADKVVLVTFPDDILIDGVRILLVDLTRDQSDIVSQSLTELESIPSVIVYSWKIGDPLNWLFDKMHKSQLIMFNAASDDQQLVGYFAGKPNSVYFGDIRALKIVNNSAVFDAEQCKEVLTKIFEKYGQ